MADDSAQAAVSEWPGGDYPVSVEVTATELQSGDLLVTDQSAGTIRLLRDGTASEIATVASWSHSYVFDAITDGHRLFVSMTGLHPPGNSYYFGVRGVGRIFQIDVAGGRLTRTLTFPEMIDPAGLVLSPDGKTLYVADFRSFHGPGRVLAIDLAGGGLRVVTSGEHLQTPVGMNADGPDHVLVASASMPEVAAMGGRIVRVALDSGAQELLYEDSSGRGELIGAGRLPGGQVVGTRSDWPAQEQSAAFVVSDGSAQDLYHPQPGWMSSGIAVATDSVWVGESTRRAAVRLTADGVADEWPLDPAYEPTRLTHSTDTLESVRLVP